MIDALNNVLTGFAIGMLMVFIITLLCFATIWMMAAIVSMVKRILNLTPPVVKEKSGFRWQYEAKQVPPGKQHPYIMTGDELDFPEEQKDGTG